ncbi:MAG: hypothetical protein F4X59_17575 [Holophagales bacterium]|nr:hypothetical protein [Holophagales bacterium]MYC11917.1 hypothetical protein [Holophagales bacterium]
MSDWLPLTGRPVSSLEADNPPVGVSLSDHFTLAEMIESATARRDAKIWAEQCRPSEEVVRNLRWLANHTLEPLRQALGGWPILVNSGYRCEALNSRIGGSRRSQHMAGEAADVRLAPGYFEDDVARVAAEAILEHAYGSSAPRLSDVRPEFVMWTLLADRTDQMNVDQAIHEYGDSYFAPSWIHVSKSDRKRRILTIVGPLTGGSYLHHPGNLPLPLLETYGA